MNSSKNWKSLLKQRMLVPVLTLGLALGVGTYEFMKPVPATAAVAAPAAAPLDDNSVSALLGREGAANSFCWRKPPATKSVICTSARRSCSSIAPRPLDINQSRLVTALKSIDG